MAKKKDDPALPLGRAELRDWRLSVTTFAVTLLLTTGIGVLALAISLRDDEISAIQLKIAVKGLVGVVCLFNLYAVYQKLQIYRIRRTWSDRERLFRLITENAQEMIALIDSNGNRLYNSPAYFRTLGYTDAELKSSTALEQIHPDDIETVREAMRAAKAGAGKRIEYRMRHKDGHWVHLESTASVIRDEQGNVDRIVIVNRDIGERRTVELRYRQALKMEAMSRISAGIAHDFNNLLGVITSYCGVLRGKGIDEARAQHAVDEIEHASSRAGELTNRLIAYSQKRQSDLTKLSLNAVLTRLQPTVQNLLGERIELRTSLSSAVGNLLAEESELEQIVVNLAVHARDSMPNGGGLLIETYNTELDQDISRAAGSGVRPGRYICMSVSDFPAESEAAAKAQRPVEDDHLGLALSIVQDSAKQCGGFFDAGTSSARGTTYRIYLPSVESEAEALAGERLVAVGASAQAPDSPDPEHSHS